MTVYSLSFVIPCANDDRVKGTVARLEEYAVRKGISCEVIVVGRAKSSWLTDRTTLLKVEPPTKGRCVKRGVLASRGEKIIVCDADLPVKVSDVDRFYNLLDFSDAVIGNRYDNRSVFENPPLLSRKIMSLGFRWILNLLFGLGSLDTQFGVKGFRSDVAKNAFECSYACSPAYDVEIILRVLDDGGKIAWIPVSVTNPSSGVIVFWKVIPHMALDVCRIWLRRSLQVKGGCAGIRRAARQ
jgi:dolichyl-phosphate beta-glucosyltransferase